MKTTKNYITVLWAFLLSLAMFSCSDDDDKAPTDKIPASASGTYTDPRDGNEYRWVRYGNTDWMADNFRYDTGNSDECKLYLDKDDKAIDAKVYGRLYTHDGAVNACPEGWRLATDEDWKNLEMALGMSSADANKYDKRGNIAGRMLTIYSDTTDINIRLAGYNDPWMAMGATGFKYLGVYGMYWTDTKDTEQGKGDNFYWYRKFVFNSSAVIRQSTTNEMLFSVRYVRDAQ
jgi:uncharacterized protein (TIGR02145 family)